MANNRTPRDLETRAQETRYEYVPVSALPDPTPEPGFTYRWIATAILGQANPTNVSQRLRDGWVPVKAVDHPELMLEGDKSGNVEIGGLMLCRIPKELLEQRAAHYNQVNKQQIDSVNAQFMKENDARMPLFSDVKTKVTKSAFGSGS